MKILVTGSRNFNDQAMMWEVLDTLDITHVVEGGARGADRLAKAYAIEHEIPYSEHPANWERHGRSAGPIRNQAMLDRHPDIDVVVAFPRADSIGTWDMISKAVEHDIDVRVVSETVPEGWFMEYLNRYPDGTPKTPRW